MFQQRTFLKRRHFETRALSHPWLYLAVEGGTDGPWIGLVFPGAQPSSVWFYSSVLSSPLSLCLSSSLVFMGLLIFFKSASTCKCHDVKLCTSSVHIKDFRLKPRRPHPQKYRTGSRCDHPRPRDRWLWATSLLRVRQFMEISLSH